ncbi:hypothetical protein TRAPUB_5729 [Trametes pubescens]|uniref:Uncharacterized protein n=1 Tax=Trametes pubescens TaxID=154538 RepID=A0A1M2V7P4_TRAPU|nr:hypothetical protein TRAPUB_5729 [Trametes pubescens]
MDYLMASFFAHRAKTPTCLGIPSSQLKQISTHFRDLAKIAARANIQTDGREVYNLNDIGEAYREALCGFQALQNAIRALGDDTLTSLVNNR